ncbi:hypothetical protein LLH06_11520 [Mucilaginibacter daejeonensis]|uniref:hypothetical protein n=1 Tax=Mucilaginibacter daejeonensis TaxID=398049 RepID=UPI001D175795|nr:hypothetical protein [Mucilaginibacter daejeonensis]UEG51600.1 hypothetical protein LLH06_11520 [Mucilaginibacter daejeonensis]
MIWRERNWYTGACILMMLMCCINAMGQHPTRLWDTLQRKMDIYRRTVPSAKLFVHFDKTIYTNNENVWFTAYLLSSDRPDDHHTLSVSLVNDVDHEIPVQERFVMNNSVGFGNILLSDTIPPGNYTFMVYTNRQVNGKPDALFTQPITIRTTTAPTFKAILSLQDTALSASNKPRNVQLVVNGNDLLPLANAQVSYLLTGNDAAVIQARTVTDKAGLTTITVPPGKNMVKTTIRSKKSSQYLYMPLPRPRGMAKVRFYPEGGQLIEHIPTRIGWEALGDNNQPLRVSGILFDDRKPIDTLSTDAYGLGSFKLIPNPGHRYTMKLVAISQKDTVYRLPDALPNGMGISLVNSIVNDTLGLYVRSSVNGMVYLNVHNYQQEFFCVPVRVDALKPRKVQVALNDLPRGIAEVTLTDSTGRPFAERLFFAHYGDQQHLTIQTNKQLYHTREKVDLALGMKSDSTDLALVSVACVQSNRIEIKKQNDIENYFYLKSDIGDLPLKQHYLGNAPQDRQVLERILLVKGWRRYTWPDLLYARAADTASKNVSLAYNGTLTINGRALKKPGNIILFRDSSTSLLSTDSRGYFDLDHRSLINTQDKPIRFLSTSDRSYQLTINDPYVALNKTLAHQWRPQSYERPLSTIETDNFVLPTLGRTIQLKAVGVSARKDNSLYGPNSGPNECGDYVCMYGILNCRNHPGMGSAPILGHVYQGRLYQGCILTDKRKEEANKTIPGIYIAKEFYGSDYAVANPSAPEYVSTIYWKYLLKVKANELTHVNFYTSDITDAFKVIVQGITNRGVVYQEQVFNVEKAK